MLLAQTVYFILFFIFSKDCLNESGQSDLVLDLEPGGLSQLLTDKDPLLGGMQ